MTLKLKLISLEFHSQYTDPVFIQLFSLCLISTFTIFGSVCYPLHMNICPRDTQDFYFHWFDEIYQIIEMSISSLCSLVKQPGSSHSIINEILNLIILLSMSVSAVGLYFSLPADILCEFLIRCWKKHYLYVLKELCCSEFVLHKFAMLWQIYQIKLG